MAECNYKHLYEQAIKMVEKYQDEIVPGYVRLLEQQPKLLRCHECKHWIGNVPVLGEHALCEEFDYAIMHKDCYCSRAERKEGESDG